MNRVFIYSKRDAICALFPYAAFLGQSGHQEVLNAISRAAWRGGYYSQFLIPILPYITTLFAKLNAPSLNRAIVLALSHVYRCDLLANQTTVMKWAAAAMEVPYTEETCLAVVSTLLSVASQNSLRSYIPVGLWKRLKNISSPPPGIYWSISWGTSPDVVRYVRGLGDIEILKSYFLFVWSEWNQCSCVEEMEISIREDFSGIRMWGHREDLVKQLDYVLGQLGRGLGYLNQHAPWIVYEGEVEFVQGKYERLKEVLLDVDKDAINTLTSAPSHYFQQVYPDLLICTESYSTFACSLPLPCP